MDTAQQILRANGPVITHDDQIVIRASKKKSAHVDDWWRRFVRTGKIYGFFNSDSRYYRSLDAVFDPHINLISPEWKNCQERARKLTFNNYLYAIKSYFELRIGCTWKRIHQSRSILIRSSQRCL